MFECLDDIESWTKLLIRNLETLVLMTIEAIFKADSDGGDSDLNSGGKRQRRRRALVA